MPDILGALIGSIEQAECHLAGGSRQLASPKWIDDAPGMNTSAHVAVAAGARNVEQAHAFHKERTFLGIEDRESLVHLNLERVTFHLAEVGIDCGVQSDVGRDSEFRTKSHVRFFVGRIPSSGSSARLADTVRDAGKLFDECRLFQICEKQMCGILEHPLPRRHFRPGIGNARTAYFSEEQDAHAHLFTARKPDRLQWEPDLDVITVIDDLPGAVPYEIRFELLSRRGRVQRIHLDAARIHEQVISRLAGAGGVETQGNPVIVECRVAPGDGGANLIGLVVEAVECEIDISIIVNNSDIGSQVRPSTAQRIVGDPVAERQRLALPGLIVKHAIDLGRLGDAHDAELRTVLGVDAKGSTNDGNNKSDNFSHRPGQKVT